MAFSLALLLLLGMLADSICRFLKLPGLIGLVAVGMILGPHGLNCLDHHLLDIGSDLRLIALIVILLRAGFSIRRKTLASLGGRIVVLSLLPSLCEAFTVAACGTYFFGFDPVSALLLGFILPAVSPAVVVPLMLKFIEEKRGTDKGIPALVLASASLDNVFNILMCGIILEVFEKHETPGFLRLWQIPLSVLSGLFGGILLGFLLYRMFEHFDPRATKRGLTLLAMALLLVKLERVLQQVLPFSAFIAILTMGFFILENREKMAEEIAAKMGKIWVFAEIALFAMVGAQFQFSMAARTGWYGFAILAAGLAARSLGVWLSLIRSSLSTPERVFVLSCNIPKATVQAAMGGVPLAILTASGLPTAPGEAILAMSVLAILFTSPLGAWLIPLAAEKCLTTDVSKAAEEI